MCLPIGYADWPHDACSLSPAKEVVDAVKAAQQKSGSGDKMKVTVCEALEGEAGDILFFPAKSSSFKTPSAFRAAALTAAGIEWFTRSAFEGAAVAHESFKCDSLDGLSQVAMVCPAAHLTFSSCCVYRHFTYSLNTVQNLHLGRMNHNCC